MAIFFASCPSELSVLLQSELSSLGFKETEKTNYGVYFESSWEGCYKVNLYSRIASRVYKPVLEFFAYDENQLYQEIQKHNFTKYIKNTQTFAVDAVVKDCAIHDQRFTAMKVKDAIVDQFRELTEQRPDVDSKNADLRVHIKGTKNKYWVALDTSGTGLYQRGYRKEVGQAPIKENLAAALIKLSGWDQQSPILDPLCGSGTFLIEAALMAMNIAPGSLRNGFGFQNWQNYKEDVWNNLLTTAMDNEKSELDFKLFGFDIDRQVIKMAKSNARNAGVDHIIEFKTESVALAKAPTEKGTLITNPPYGARIGEEDNLKDLYRDLGYALKNNFRGWNCWVLSGNRDLILEMKLKSEKKYRVYNGPIECRLLQYSIF